ncbi:DUF6233 domain-containing protein [Streptomyces sp. NBC_01518]
MWLDRIDRRIAAILRRQVEQEQGERNQSEPPASVVALGIGAGRPPVEVHIGDCYAAGKRRRAVDREEARRLLATGVRACDHCRPDATLSFELVPPLPRPGGHPFHRLWSAVMPCSRRGCRPRHVAIGVPGAQAGPVERPWTSPSRGTYSRYRPDRGRTRSSYGQGAMLPVVHVQVQVGDLHMEGPNVCCWLRRAQPGGLDSCARRVNSCVPAPG